MSITGPASPAYAWWPGALRGGPARCASPAMPGLLQPLARFLPWHPWPPERGLAPALGYQSSCQQAGALWPAERALASQQGCSFPQGRHAAPPEPVPFRGKAGLALPRRAGGRRFVRQAALLPPPGSQKATSWPCFALRFSQQRLAPAALLRCCLAAPLEAPLAAAALPGGSAALCPRWQRAVKRPGAKRSRQCCGGSKHAAPQLRLMAATWPPCAEALAQRMCMGLRAWEGLRIPGCGARSACAHSPAPLAGTCLAAGEA